MTRFLNKVLSAASYPDKLTIRIGKAQQILEQDPAYQEIMTQIKLNADNYFNTYHRQSDKFVEEGEKEEVDLVKKAEQREKELGLKKTPNGFLYYAGKI